MDNFKILIGVIIIIILSGITFKLAIDYKHNIEIAKEEIIEEAVDEEKIEDFSWDNEEYTTGKKYIIDEEYYVSNENDLEELDENVKAQSKNKKLDIEDFEYIKFVEEDVIEILEQPEETYKINYLYVQLENGDKVYLLSQDIFEKKS